MRAIVPVDGFIALEYFTNVVILQDLTSEKRLSKANFQSSFSPTPGNLVKTAIII